MRIFLSAFLVVCAQFAVAQADVPGCNIEIACNYDPAATLNDGSCDFTSCLVLGCTDAAACNYNPAATINDGSCDYLSCLVPGCTLANACNFDASAEVNDGSCEYTSCAGCTNPFADNYDDTATVDDGSCNPIEGCTSPQACNFNENANQDDGSCDFVSCLATGCTVLEACNYDAEAQVNDGTCIFPEEGRDCNGVCLEDADGDDVCDGDEIAGCTSATALNYNPIATDDDGSCQEPVGGCTDPEACNFDALATNDDGSCEFTSCAGCLQQAACNYDSTAIYADDSCEFPPFGYDCDGNCLNDADGDDVCDPFEVVGCQDESACNFDPAATDPGQCNFATPNFDCDGNSLRPIFTSFPANVTVQGWQVPAIEDAIVEAIASPFAPSFEATYNGNDCYDSDPTPSISFLGETKIDGVCEHDYTLFRSWMATDCSGYTRTREQIIVVVDTVPPVLFVPEAMTVLCQDAATADFGEAYGTDDCGDVTIEISEEIVSGDCPGNYTIVRTFSAMDPCLNTATGQQEITVIDNEAPVILALADRSLDCSDEMPTDMPEATDNCGNVTISVVETVIPGTCANEYSIERLFTATDECGNESTSTQLISVSDNTAPTVVSGYNGCDDPATCAIAVDGLQGETLPAADLELSDDCDDAPVFASSDEVLSSTDALEVILREYTISDACGNTLVLQEQYNVTLVNPGCTDEAACNYDADANVSDGSCDFCSCGQNACGCLDQAACNYDSSAEYDDDSCTYADPGFDCDGICYDINGNDICDFEESGCTDSAACNYDSFAQVDDGSCDYCCAHDSFTSTEAEYGVSIDLVQTHTTGDLAGLSTYRVYVTTPNADDVLTAVTGGDEFPLELHTTTSFYQNVFGGCLGTNISPGMMVVAPDAAYDSWVTIGATSSDDVVDGEVQLIPGAWIESFEAGNSITVNDNLGSGWFLIPPGGVNGVSGDDNRILVAQLTTDGVISGSFRVQIFPSGDQVNDVRPDLTFEQQPLGAFACPIIEEGPADAVVSCDDIPGLPGDDEFTLSYANSTADALGCDGALQITLVSDDITEGDCTGNYTILRTVEIENCAGGTAQHTYTLTVEDTTAPEFSEVPEDYTVECSAEMVMADASALDNCSEVSIEVSSETIAGNATGNYTLVRTFTATDACGNSSTATQTITVEDTTAPVFTSVPEAYTVECSDDMVLEDATAEDNCNGADIQVTSEIIAGNATGNYTVVRTFTATDDAGNSASATQTITVQDTTAPEFTSVPADYTTECSDDLILEDAVAMDNCNGAVISVSSETIAGDAAGNYTVVRTFTATDDAGNSASAQQTITVQDTTAPELSIPADYAAECTEELLLDDATATDNCGSVVVEVSTNEVAGDCPGTKVVTRTFTATDDAGNSTSATQTITVQDTTAPELSIPADYTSECSDDLVLEAATATDNCTTCEDEFSFTSSVEGYGLSLELVASHEDGALAGMRTYRVYLDVAHADDQVTSFTGNDEFALSLNTTTNFYQNAFGGETSNDISAGAIGLVPELAFDSYVTVGLTGQPEGQEGSVELIPGSWADAFEAGQSFTINDGIGSGWYIVPPVAVNGLGGADQRVLVAQLTTDGDISGQFRTQVFPQGDQVNDVRADLTFVHNRACSELTIEESSETIDGDAAGNYTVVRTFTATDACGNSTSATQTITVQDTTAPEFTSVPADYTSECSDDLILDDATASDNCGEVTIEVSSETIDGDAAGNYIVVRTFTATDDAGNSTSAQQTITVQDTTAPEFTSVPADYTSECDADLILDDATASDNCGEVTIEVSSETIAGDAAGNYTVVRTFTATDDAGNSTSAQQTITVQDTTAPEFTSVPADYTSECSDDLILDDATASDNCGEVTIEVSSETISGDAAGNYTVVRTFTATDDAGNSTSAQQTITVQDTTAPELSIPADYTSECDADLILDDATASDNCGEVTIEVSSETIAGDAAGNYTVVRTFTATDDAGNSTSAQQTITVQDTTAPEFTSVPADYTSECSDDLILDDATASDNCGEVTIEVSSETISGDAAGNYTVVRTFTATDDAGNSTSAQQTITVQDTTAPEFTSVPADYTSECSDDLILDDATASDNCGEVTIEVSSETIDGDAAGNYTVVRTFTATDDAGNSTSAQQTITVQDTTAPEFTSVPADYTSECSDDLILDDATASDNCGEVTIEVSSETIDGDAAGNYTVVRTFTATDDAGNSTSAQQTITVQDTTAPELSIPADYTSECDADLILDDATASDNCGEVTIEVSSETIAGDAAGNYTVVRTFTATDDAGNSTSAQQTITVQDTTAPEFTSVPADYTSECSDDLILDDATASDNCGEVTIEVSSETISGDAAGNYTVVRTFTATDDAGNSTSAQQTITVQDTTAPEFTSVPADYTSECSDDLILDDATASDNCGEVTIEISSETIAGDAAGNYIVVRTFTATDDAGNSTSAQQTITVQDTTAPELSIPADYTSECDADLILDDATASDNCGEVTIEVSSETIAGDAAGNYTVVRTFTATDDAGNSTSAQQTITVQDTTAPELSIPADYTAECDADLILDDATASDNCGEVTIEVSSETIAGDAAGNYTVVRTFTATDDAGNSTSAQQTITVQDTTAPEFTSVPADYTSECDVDLILDDATASDNCGEVTIEVSSETIAGDCPGNYTVVRTFTATDDAGNSTSAQQTITVQDTTAPELSIPADYTSECSDDLVLEAATATDNCTTCEDEFSFTSSVEGYGLSLELVASHEDGALAGMRTYRVYLDVADADDQVTSFTGNDEFALSLNTTTNFYQNALGGVTPNDISAGAIGLVPELAFDSYVTVGLTGQPEGQEGSVELIPGSWADAFEAGQSFTINDGIGSGWYIVPPVAVNGLGGADQRVLVAQLTTDGDISGQFRTQVFPQGDQVNDVRADLTFVHNRACSELTIEESSETIDGDAAGNYTVVRTFTATDACGNSTSATQTITVQDTTAPEFTSVPADYTSECSDDLILDDATASDNCGEVTIEVSSETIDGDAAGNYTVVRTFTATDDAGNSTSAQQTITVQDTTAPEFTSVPADYTSECDADLILDDATASDNCGEVTIEVSSETISGDAAGNYTVVRTFTATDDAGNSTSAQQTITVQDTTAPELSIPADYTSECSDDLILDDATASDNCGEVTIEVSSETIAGDAAGNYTVVRTFTATDDAGNSTSAQQTITVQDTTAPEFTSVPADYTSECSDDLILDDATASDNCGEVTIEVSSETIDGDAAGNYTVVRTFTATDDAGNSTSAQQTITVQDTTAPEFTSVPADYTSECSDDLILDDATASDNCGEVTIEVSSETIAGDAAGNYTVVRTFTATDDAGNSTSAQQTITVQDTTAPEFTSVPADYTSECSDDLILDDATASDNCGEVTIEVSSETIAGDAAGNYTVVRTFTATDDAGNSTSAQQTITVQDTTAPEFTSVPADYTSECSDDLILDDATASDNCGEVTIEVSSETIAGDAAGNYTVVRTFTATDDAGNSTSAQQTITVQDTTAPELSIPADYTSECDADLILDDATASDNCGEVTIEVSSETISGDAAGNYTVVRTFTATDDAGNSTSAQQTITVQDTTAPELSIPADYTAECDADLILDDATASDNCGEVTIEVSSETISGDAAGNYTVVRTFTATDDAGNSTSAQQTITVQDTTAPELSIPADYTSECDADLILDDATASDNCGEVTIEVSSETIAGDCPGNYTVVRTFTATDDAGNSTSAQQTITVQDTTAPELSIPADYTSECSDDLVLEAATATDNCTTCEDEFSFTSSVEGYGLSLELVASHEDGALAGMRTYRVYLDVADADDQVTSVTGNDEFALSLNTTTNFYQNALGGVTPNDISAGAIGLVPELAFDSYVTVGLTGQPEGQEGSVELIPGSWADAFEAGQSFTINDGIGSGWYIVPPVAVNGLGGADQRVLVAQLTTDGDISGQFRTQVFPQGDQVNDVRADLTFVHNRACSELTIEESSETIDGDAAGNYTVVRTFTATDACGNSTSATQTITVQDTTAPEFTSVPADYTSECSDDLILDDATASDNCGEVTIEVSSETIDGDAAGNYTVVRTFTATDDAGNSTSAQQTITVQDTTAPEFTSVPADYTSECDADLILDDATASDNCGEVTIEVSSETIDGDAAGNYTVVRTFTATDDAGNSTSAQQTITVQDTTAPEFTSVPADYTSECSDDLILDDATASDNCGEVTIEVSSETIAGDAAGNYTVVRTFTATDDAGNSTSAQQTITVQDTTAPELSIPADYTSECSDDLILDDATASDNCGEVTIEVSSETIAGDAAGNYTVVRTFTATDDAGNSTSAQQTITVQDTTAPEFTSVPADYTSECSDDLILDDATASDNCGEVTIEVSSETISGDAAGNYTVVRTFTATDDAGNSTSAQQTITVQDTTAPEFTSVPADYTSECSDDLILDDATASDNCGEVTIEVSSETISGDAAGNYTVVRTFTATDDAGNSTSAQQTITVQDTTAPEFTSVPADYTSECSDDLILDDATASDNCGEVTIEISSETISGDAAGNYTVVRTFTATDDAGNSTSAQQTITVQDTTAPEFTSVPADYTSECDADLILDDATASDNCGEVTIEVSSETIAGDAAGNYTVVRTFTATDDAGNSTSAQQTITVQDTTAPELSIPADYTSECDVDLILDDATASDNCGEVTIEVSSETIAGDAAGNYTVVRTFTATDDAGNSTSAQQTITVQDTTAPEFTSVPADYTSECDVDLILDDATASDNCGEVTIEVSSETIAGDAAGNYTVVRTFTATDDAGNSTSAQQTITVQDTTAPEFTSVPADYTSECDVDLILDDATASDNCGEVTIEVSSETISGDAAGNYTVVRTFTATDDAGNSTSAQQTITVQDTTAPELSIPADYTSECSDDLILDDATASDNCGEVTIEVSSETISGDAAGNYTVVRTFTASDDAGNSTSAQQTITVQDTTAPEFTSVPADYTSECDADLILDDATASDNCGEVTIEVSSETISGDAAGNYTVVRTFTATDDAGNSTSAQQTITVQDTTAPELSIPADYTSECSDDLILDDATASDNCGEVTIEVSSETIAGDAAGNYTVVRTFTATDDAGNSTSAQQTITVQDTTAPEFTSVPADYTSECDADLILDDATASDNCGEVTIEVSSETIDGDAAGNYTVVRTFTATDDAGNSTSAQQTITVQDTTAPELSIPADYTSECDADLILDDATASDNCGEVTIEVSSETISGDAAGNYTVVRTFTATDDAGNSTSAQQTITVQDTTAPELSIPADYTSECSDDLILDDATASDNCGEVTIEVSSETIAGDAAGNYTVVRTFTATDDAGNSTSAQQTITVQDTTAPELSIPADYTSECSDDLILDDATASDNCGEVTIEVSSETIAGDAAGNYTVVRTFTATDDAGNSTSAQQTITVQDTTAPEFTSVPADYTSECDVDLILDDATASDNCGEVTIEVSSETISGDAAGNYTVVRTFTATDDAGNSTSAQQTITVQDTTAPEFTSVPADYTSECSDDLILDDATASDNCGEVTIEISSETISGDAAGNYTVVRTFTATDDAGNSTSAQQTITVQDTTAPEFTSVPADYTSECDVDLILDDATASDNCGEVTIEVSSETIAGDAAGNYTVVRTFTATDDAGNSTSAQQTITVQDTTAPELSIPADYTSECSDDLILEDATASDNCGEVTIEVSSETIAGDAAGNYTVVRTFTATDDAGNSTSAQQTITVQDTTAPELSIPADYTSECDVDLILDDATASDNCGAVTIELSEEILDGSCVNEYVMLRTFTATDDAGNSTSATQTITVVDTTGPELFIPPSYEADCGDDLLLLDALANDACGVAIVTVEESVNYTCDNSYVLTRTFTAVDACFNQTVGVQTITVTDSTAPEFTSVPSGFSAECSEDLILDDATATDDCSAVDVTVAIDTIPGDCDNTYTLVRTFTASDACGNSSTATQTIEISDTTAPTFTFVPEDQLIECNIGLDGTMATAEDACGNVTVTVDEVLEQGQCGGVYVITRTFTATDACGNSTSAVQTITQQDTTDPTLSIGADVTIECDEEVPAPEYVADDACGAVTVEVTEEMVAGDCPQEMTILRTYVATDDCGNSTTAVQTINIEDTTAPIFTFTPPATSIVYAAEGDTLAVPFVVVLDNCDTEATWSVDEQVLVDSPNELTVERLYTATDACGNEATYTETTTLVLQVLGCTDPGSCNFDEFANEDDGSCFYPLYAYDCDGNCINDVNDNDICDELEVAGCTDPENPGYNPEANIDDGSCLTGGCTIAFACNYDPGAEFQIAGSCEFESCAGCTSEEACNYDEDATLNNGSCEFPDYAYDCDGNCINDTDGDGICDEFEIAGCTDPDNPAYNPAATDDDGSCLVAGCLLPFACNFDPTADYLDVALCDLSSCAGCTDPAACTFDPDATLSAPSQCTYPVNQFVDCDGVCLNDVDGDGVCDELEIPGCTNPEASNFSPFATDDNGTCIVEVGGCTLPFACNYDPTADFYLPGSCDFSCLFGMPPGGDDCSDEFACNFGADEPCAYFDGAGNLCATVGCMNEEACNFNPDAQVNSGCEYASCLSLGCTNANACNFDLNANTDNGTCEYSSCVGCMNNEASNFDPEATIDNGQCTYDVFGCTLLIACNYNPSATVNDGTCDFAGCFGCVTPTACNYNADALYPDGSCEFASAGQDCNGNCLQDQDGDFICDANEVAGCTDGNALNFNPNATDDNGSCTYLTGGCTNQTACNFDYTAQVDDGSCDFATCSGCIVSWACNYDETATLNDGSCIFPDVSGQCPNSCDFDVDGDGICDSNEVLGCTYVNATNYLPLATDDDGSCSFLGCVEPDFSSYNALANTDDGGCTNSPKSADFNGDGVVQLEDLLEFLVAYGSAGPDWGLDWVQDGCSVVAMGIADMDVSTSGCTYPTAANFDPTATMDLGTCVWLGCTDDEALNYNNLATLDDSSCRYNVCPDFNGDGQVQTQDLLDFLVAWGQVYE